MAKRLTTDQRNRVAEKVMEWGNLAFVGLVISQIVPGPEIRWSIAIAGVMGLFGAYYFAHRLMTKGG